ncbi:MAG: hypothetical protein LBQ88_08935 [Treponema sp.]|jgi:hypothetical protein|nr:hypothetical protein [Treponema sp.]
MHWRRIENPRQRFVEEGFEIQGEDEARLVALVCSAGSGRRVCGGDGGCFGCLYPERRPETTAGVYGRTPETINRGDADALPVEQGSPERFDTEYACNGTCELFMFVAPLAGWRREEVIEHRKRADGRRRLSG